MKDLGEVTLKTGDIINGDKIISIVKDLFVANQICIFVDRYEVDEFGDSSLVVYRINGGRL